MNWEIRDKTVSDIEKYRNAGDAVIADRIEKLNREWDTERVLETNAASAVLLSSAFDYSNKKCCWFLITGAVGFFLLQHALQGRCPSLLVIRGLGCWRKLGLLTAWRVTGDSK